MGIRLVNLASGSKGNCTYISDGVTNVLVDDGLSLKRLGEAARQAELDLPGLSGVFVTHEHIDHYSGISRLVKTLKIPVICPPLVRKKLLELGVLLDENDFYRDAGFQFGSLYVEPFRVMHDTVYPVGYTFSTDTKKAAVATDLGKVTDSVKNALLGSDVALIESNHDVKMLQSGSYPYPLKQRILGTNGHLSNDAASELACTLAANGTEELILGHLSEDNNLPLIAFGTTESALQRIGANPNRGGISLKVAGQRKITYSEVK